MFCLSLSHWDSETRGAICAMLTTLQTRALGEFIVKFI